ncbi:MAG: M3 family metallopeptidase [Bacteroidales bacterium]|nr:M3 family metallopeptidase [Bacteroidales bacterium]
MKKITLLVFAIGLIFASCTEKPKKMENPLLSKFETPHGVPPFDLIKVEHFIPAYKEAMKKHSEEIAAIVNNPEVPSFENTIEAFEFSGKLLTQVAFTFNNLNTSLTNDDMQNIAKEVAPLSSKHSDDIMLNAKLFKRVKAVYENKDNLKLSSEQARLLEVIYKKFERGGANLNAENQDKLRKINSELSLLTLQFDNNVLAETNDYKMVLDKESDLAGLPESVIKAAAKKAKEEGMEGKWIFTTHKPSLLPFLTYAKNRELRKKLHTAYIMRGDNNNQYDNKKILSKIAKLRVDRAKLFGFESHAAYVLDANMAKTPETVFNFLNKVWEAVVPMAKKEAAELQEVINREGGKFKLAHWDWWYYSEKLRKQKYALDEEMLRPYFERTHVRNGAFDVANKLWGLKFVEKNDIPKYHKDVEVFEVLDSDDSFLGILYMDWYPRPSKSGGAWMDAYVKQSEGITPVITTNFNFTAPVEGKPALLTIDEVTTTFHEFGHALHGLLSKCKYHTLAGTAVTRDFVELPSQVMENWSLEPEVMKMYAKHYETGEVIPDALIQKIANSGLFNKGFTVLEYTSAALLDMYWHTMTEAKEQDATKFENDVMKKLGMIDEIVVRYRSPYFSHIFAGGYSSGYYSYQWAQVLDADAFSVFKEKGLFDQATATSFRNNVFSRGNTEPSMDLYKKFRGMEPQLDAFLERNGLK